MTPLSSGKHGAVYALPLTPLLRESIRLMRGYTSLSPFPNGAPVIIVKKQKNTYVANNEFAMHSLAASPSSCTAGGGCSADVVPALYGSVWNRHTWLLFMENIEGPTLHDVLQRQNQQLTKPQYDKIQDAVLKLWVNGISHSDLHDKNVVFERSSSGPVKFLDLGFAFRIDPRLSPAAAADADPWHEFAQLVQRQANMNLTGRMRFKGPARTANTRMLKRYFGKVMPPLALPPGARW